MKNKKLLLIVSLALAMMMSLGGTLAYLTDMDADVNTMVLGNVDILQNEQMWNDDESLLVEYQEQPLMPYVGELGWENTALEGGAYRRFTMNNVVDKYVTVTNIGKSDAYVRTIIALEMGDYTYEDFKMIGISINAENGSEFKFPGAWVWTEDFVTTIDGKNYNIMVAEHQDILKPEETTIPSLLQVYLDKNADNEEVDGLDGNENGKYDILVISQAVQADGFGSAAEALAAAFPYGADEAAKKTTVTGWFESIDEIGIESPSEKYPTNNPPSFEAASAEELVELLEKGANVTLTDDVDLGEGTGIAVNNSDLNLNEKSIDADYVNYNGVTEVSGGTMNVGTPNDYSNIARAGSNVTFTDVNITSAGGGIAATDGAEVTFDSGKVAVNTTSTSGRYIFYAVGEGTVITINDGEFSWSTTLNQKRAYIYASVGTTVYVNGGNFGKASTRDGYTAGILGDGTVIITGGTFKFDPSKWVADGYEAVESNGVWTVSAK